MIEIGGLPILGHILRHYQAFGHSDFVIALGYKGAVIKSWISDLARSGSDVRDASETDVFKRLSESLSGLNVDLVETGERTNTGGRIKALADSIGNQRFMLTWGDGVSDVDLDALLAFHQAHGKLATMTVVRPPPRFGHVTLDGPRVVEFSEKPLAAEGWINGAFFVLEPGVFDYIDGPETQFEKEPMQNLAQDGELMAYRHDGFWQCMDTIHDRETLEAIWATGRAPWIR